MDVAFVVDKTRSIGVVNFVLLNGFLLQLVGAMHISPDTTHAGVITFNRKVLILFTDGRTNENSKPFSEIIPLLNVRFKLRLLYCSFTFIITCNEEVKLSIELML